MDNLFINQIKTLYLKYNDPYLIIKDLLINYNKFNFNDINECKQYIINILEDIFDENINETKLNDYLMQHKLSLDRSPQEHFRHKLIQKYNSCIVTNNHYDECEASHIKPLENEHNYDINNGLLLSSSLHTTFDKFIWSINNNGKIIVVNNNNQYLIRQYEGKVLQLDNDVMNNLKWHYEQFILINK